jgi:hypothetical protein
MFSVGTVGDKIRGYVKCALRNKVAVSLGFIVYIYVIVYIIFLCIT